jgi:hypothetical protein
LYRRKITLGERERHGWPEISCWPRFGEKGKCAVCLAPLTNRQRTFCKGRGCRSKYLMRLYVGVHWTKRHIIVRDGCACKGCGEVFESALVDGGVLLPMPHSLELDHIKPLIEGGGEEPENLQLLCEKCHDSKSAQERKRGYKRNPILPPVAPPETDFYTPDISPAAVLLPDQIPAEHLDPLPSASRSLASRIQSLSLARQTRTAGPHTSDTPTPTRSQD